MQSVRIHLLASKVSLIFIFKPSPCSLPQETIQTSQCRIKCRAYSIALHISSRQRSPGGLLDLGLSVFVAVPGCQSENFIGHLMTIRSIPRRRSCALGV